MINPDDVHDLFSLIDAVDHPVSATTCQVIAAQFAGKGLVATHGLMGTAAALGLLALSLAIRRA